MENKFATIVIAVLMSLGITVTATEVFGYMPNMGFWNVVPTGQYMNSTWAPAWSNLMGYWKLNETAGSGTVSDSSGYTNTGTVHSGVTLGVSGKLQTAASFNGSTNGWIDLGAGSNLYFAGNITMAVWLYQTNATVGSWQNMIVRDYITGVSVYLRNYGGASGTYNCGGNSNDANYAIPVADRNNWVFMACEYNGTAWVLYRNGVKVVTGTATATGATATTGIDWTLGNGSHSGTARYYYGSIAEASIWNTALTATQLELIYHHQATVYEAFNNFHGELFANVWDPSDLLIQ
jgi:hypothetical protein